MKKLYLPFAVLLVMVLSGFFGKNLMQVMAEEQESISYQKYYTSIRLEKGDTLWDIAEQYGRHSGKSTEEYVRELKKMNGLSDDLIHAGNYLTIAYYQPVGSSPDNLTSGQIYSAHPHRKESAAAYSPEFYTDEFRTSEFHTNEFCTNEY